MTKLTKKETDYSRGMRESHCGKVFKDDKGYCKNYEEPNGCSVVDGNINPVFWCKEWQKQKP